MCLSYSDNFPVVDVAYILYIVTLGRIHLLMTY